MSLPAVVSLGRVPGVDLLSGLLLPAAGSAAAVTLVSIAALILCRGLARRPAPLRHGLFCATVAVAILAAPAELIASRLGWRLSIPVPTPRARAAAEAGFFLTEAEASDPASALAAETPPLVPAGAAGRMSEARSAAPNRKAWLAVATTALAIWIIGIAIGAVLLLRDLILLRRFMRSLEPCADSHAAHLLADAAQSVGLSRPPRLRESAAAGVPLVAGPLAPVVVMPKGLTRRMPREQLAAVFVHEAAHVAHSDLWIGLAQRLAAILFWWCPPLHAVNRRLAEIREEICDNHVLRSGASGLALAEALVALASGLPARRRRLAIGTLGTIDERTGLVGRVHRLLEPSRRDTSTRMTPRAALATIAFTLATLSLTAVTALRAADGPAVDVSAVTPAELAAIDAALEWLAARQDDDGGWTMDGRFINNRIAATALAVLPFLGRGHTHLDGPYREPLAKGLGFIADRVTQGKGDVAAGGGTMYTQGLAALTLCRAYALTKDESLAAPAQDAVDFIVAAQDPVGGGWRYAPRQPGDTSVLGWQFAALAAAKAADLKVNPLTIKGVITFLDSVQAADGASYGYVGGGNAGPATACTAIGLLVRNRTGWKPDDERLVQGAQNVATRGPGPDLYFTYHASRLMHALGGDAAPAWRDAVRQLLLNAQTAAGDDRGSWLDGVDKTAMANRLYCTALATLILEVPLAARPQ